MKGIILAGGNGSRLYPLTFATNKHLLPVYDVPMIYYPIRTLVQAGIKDIMIVTGGVHAGDFIKVLKNGEDFGLTKFNYAYQEGSGGIADALSMAETFVGDDSCAVILGDNIITDDISSIVSHYAGLDGAVIFTKDVEDAERFGVLEFDETGTDIVDIIEKPTNPPSNCAVIGLYMYDKTVFDKIHNLSPSDRGELEVTDLNKMYLAEGNLEATKLQGTWIDCGTPDSLAKATLKFYNDKKEN
jgi:glucose-1-phosphate thymidylyltransferase